MQHAETDRIIRLLIEELDPMAIILFGRKTVIDTGELSGLDFCVIGHFDDKKSSAKHAYLAIDSTVPYNLYLYTVDEWKRLSNEDDTFAGRVRRKGTVLYEKK